MLTARYAWQQGSASLVRKEARLRQHLHRANAAAVEAYEQRAEERRVMMRVRLELESLRILLQRINKREKLKREGITLISICLNLTVEQGLLVCYLQCSAIAAGALE